MQLVDIHHLVPYVYLFTQEALDDGIGEKDDSDIEVGTDHQVVDDDVWRYDSYLVLFQCDLFAIHHALHLAACANGNGTHGDAGRGNLNKLLDAVDNDNVVVRISDIDVLIVCQAFEGNLLLLHVMFLFVKNCGTKVSNSGDISCPKQIKMCPVASVVLILTILHTYQNTHDS